MAVRQNATYNVGNVSKTQSQLNNNMSGTDANAIYYATHGGSGNTDYVADANAKSSNSGSYVTFDKPTKTKTKTDNDSDSKGSGSGGGIDGASLDFNASGGFGGGVDYAGMIEAMLEKQRQAAREAYDASRGRLEDAWGNTQDALGKNLGDTLDRLKRQYDYSNGIINDDAARSLREAYVNYMLNRKNLNQNLSAAGISGGATESTMANMFNNYGNSRNDINTQLSRNLADLLNEYQNNTSQASQTYNVQFADAMNNYVNNLNNLEQMLASNLMSNYSGSSLSNLANYVSTLNNLAMQGSYTPTVNNLSVDAYNTTQANDAGSVTDYAKYLNMIKSMQNTGTSYGQIVQTLKNTGADLNTIYKLLGV